MRNKMSDKYPEFSRKTWIPDNRAILRTTRKLSFSRCRCLCCLRQHRHCNSCGIQATYDACLGRLWKHTIDFGKENQLRTTPATNITRLSATVTGEATLSSTPTELGFLVSTSSSMADAKNYRVSPKNGSIQCEITGLTGGTTYYYCVYASSGINTLREHFNRVP